MPIDQQVIITPAIDTLIGDQILITNGVQTLIARQGPEAPKISDGYGGWKTIDRPRRVGLTQYVGRNPFQMVLNLMFDGYADKASQELRLRQLMWMGLKPEGEREPRPVKLLGPLPYPSSGQWVINGIEMGNTVIWNADNKARYRQDVNVTLLEYVKADRVEFISAGLDLAPVRPPFYIVKDGDTIRKIAQMFYADFMRWRDIAAANVLKDPDHLVTGQRLRLP